MRKVPISLQDLRRRIYRKAKSDKAHRFWGLFTHMAKPETLAEAYRISQANAGAPGSDGLTFEAVEAYGRQRFLDDIRAELLQGTYEPRPPRRVQDDQFLALVKKMLKATGSMGVP
jgi:RNA-directed DNA polymerase